ncbi:hypothetical protein F383_04927 [Gossypium arboreum]|uniref:Uncharacterized protein n=1 Tax=Gossypium arboreum TaxID=29729 RepID=A0A0B0NH02_GOSAR|nr:hypothetical protein F383_04927 [Gossypium arboreum]
MLSHIDATILDKSYTNQIRRNHIYQCQHPRCGFT